MDRHATRVRQAELAINRITVEHNGGTKNYCNHTAIDNGARSQDEGIKQCRRNVRRYRRWQHFQGETPRFILTHTHARTLLSASARSSFKFTVSFDYAFALFAAPGNPRRHDYDDAFSRRRCRRCSRVTWGISRNFQLTSELAYLE